MTGETYQASGVQLDAMEDLKDRIKAFASMTHGPEVLSSGGGFAGLFQLSGFREPVLVASADGVGTKLKIAAQLGHFESIGQDLVTLNVNDILTKGAKPLFFLDYVSFSHLDQQRMETLLRGITWGCREVGCALIGGETAQMPGLYAEDDFDLAGFLVGVSEKDGLLQNDAIVPGDILVGIPSSGLHTNGFSLVRRVFNSDSDPSVLFRQYGDLNHTLGEELLTRHRCYYPALSPSLGAMKGLAHITGGGLPGKVPGILPANVAASFRKRSWDIPTIFSLIQQEGNISEDELYRVFNMGLGMVAVCAETQVDTVLKGAPDAVVVGSIMDRPGEEQVIFTT
ncbi:MAG: phosphoribosylformylglycinamidine cyclo-ligase [Chloroflexota bacterium]|nr:phosphoribosylformylglycinamidine cyclo-ligase [Chloroflexota bacterium]